MAGAICVPILLALYLLKLRRRPLRVGSILFWPKASDDAQVNVPFRWLRPSWLLFLHLLALLFLLLALARPTIESEGGASERVVLLIDTSASMASIDTPSIDPNIKNPTRLDRAKTRATELIKQLRSEDRRSISVVSFAATAQTLAAFTPSASIINDAIETAAQTDQPANLPAALTLVESLTAESGSQTPETQSPPTVILLSDGSYPADDGDLSTSLRLRYERIGPEDQGVVDEGRTYQITPRTDNLGIANIAARRDDINPALVRVFARVVSNNTTAIDVPMSLAIEGVVSSRRAIRIPAANAENKPGEQQVIFEVPASPKGILTITIDRPDSLESDNIASVVLPDQFRPIINVVTQSTTSTPTSPRAAQDFAWLITDVLDELGCERVSRRTIDEYTADQLTSTTSDPHLTIFVGVSPAKPPRGSSVHFGGDKSIPPLAFTTTSDSQLGAPEMTPRPGSIYWDRTHPLMRGVPLDSLIVRRALAWTISDELLAANKSLTATVLARSDDTPLITLINDAGAGAGSGSGGERIAIGFDLIDSNWPLQPAFAVFLANVVDRLTPRARSFVGQAFTTGESAIIRVQGRQSISLSGPADILVREGGGGTSNPSLLAPGATESISAGLLAKAGVYLVKGAGQNNSGSSGGDRAIAVNVANELESMALAPLQVQLGSKQMTSFESGTNTRELWREFLLAAGLLLSIEWLVYGWQVRK
ncbi:MAG: VWA domain-containing protein [Phycisphaerales bacterium]